MKTGLCSVSFRKLTVEELIEKVKEAGLDGIEWGSDVHVPAGDVEKAKYVAKLMEEAGLETLGYGTYFCVGDHPTEDFRGVIDCAVALGTKRIRVWGGTKTLAETTEEYRAKVVADSQAICDMAKPYGLMIGYEYHHGTLTETLESAELVLKEVGRENIKTYWQPRVSETFEENLHELKTVLPHVCNLHMFQWDKEYQRYALEDGAELIKAYLDMANTNPQVCGVMLEFVKDDDIEQMKRDAATLNRLAK